MIIVVVQKKGDGVKRNTVKSFIRCHFLLWKYRYLNTKSIVLNWWATLQRKKKLNEKKNLLTNRSIRYPIHDVRNRGQNRQINLHGTLRPRRPQQSHQHHQHGNPSSAHRHLHHGLSTSFQVQHITTTN